MYQRNRLFAQSLSKNASCLNSIYLIYFHNSFRNDPVRTIIARMVCEALRNQQGASVQLRWYEYVLDSFSTRTKGEGGSGEVRPGCSLLAGTKWWRACWSWSAFLWCHWLSVNYNIASPPPPTIIQKFTAPQHFTWANKSTEVASCLVSQHEQSIRGHYLYQIEMRGNLSAVKSAINLPNTSHSQRAKSGETTVGNSFKRILSHWFTKERAFSKNIVLSVCSGSIFNVYSFGCFTGECKSEKCRSSTGVCKMNTTQHSRLHPLLAQLLRHRALCAEDLGKKKQHSRIIIAPFQGEDEIHVISWDLCLSRCCPYVCLWENLAKKLFIVTLRDFCKAMPLTFLFEALILVGEICEPSKL